jgi:hypothetical protein
MARRSNPAKAVQVLDMMLEFFDGGRRWTRGEFHNHGGHRCLIGALRYVRRQQNITGRDSEYYLRAAIIAAGRTTHQHTALSPLVVACVTLSDLMNYNDLADSYVEVRRLIENARALAEAEIENVDERPHRYRSIRQSRAEGRISGDPRHPIHDAPRAAASERSY